MDCRVFFYTQKSERRCANACSFDRHRLAPARLDFCAGVLRQRHGCSHGCGDCHSFHFPPRRLRELKKKIHFFIKGLDKTKNHADRRRVCVKSSCTQRIYTLLPIQSISSSHFLYGGHKLFVLSGHQKPYIKGNGYAFYTVAVL